MKFPNEIGVKLVQWFQRRCLKMLMDLRQSHWSISSPMSQKSSGEPETIEFIALPFVVKL